MKKGTAGISMGSRISNVHKKVKAIPCNCKKCFHLITKGEIQYCKFYDLFSPNKKKCKRYYEVSWNS